MPKKETRKFTIEIDVPIMRKTERKLKGKTIMTIPMKYHVEGMMTYIKRCFHDKNHQDLLDEYAKLYLLKQAGVETYPLDK